MASEPMLTQEQLAAIVYMAAVKEKHEMLTAYWLASNIAATLAINNPAFDRRAFLHSCFVGQAFDAIRGSLE